MIVKISNKSTVHLETDYKGEQIKYINATKKSLLEIGQIITEHLKVKILNPPKSGHIYSYPFKKFHQASAKGQYPANLTGVLRHSYRFKLLAFNKLVVGTPIDYGLFLEEGTRGIAKRAGIEQAFADNSQRIDRVLKTNLNAEIKRTDRDKKTTRGSA